MPDPIRLRVTKSWRASYDPALNLRAGDEVTPGRKDDDNPGWQWVVDQDGLGGWVPQDILSGHRVASDFNTIELSVSEGATVTSLARRAGWHWCRNNQGHEGWLPATHLCTA